jgi:hypothetical protein
VKPARLVVFRYDDKGVETLEDGLYALSGNLADPAMQDRLARFVARWSRGWRFAAAPAHRPGDAHPVAHGRADAAGRRRRNGCCAKSPNWSPTTSTA